MARPASDAGAGVDPVATGGVPAAARGALAAARGAGGRPRTAILHYSAPPVVGGVEAVIHAHVNTFLESGYSAGVVAGRGAAGALPAGAAFNLIPEMDSRHPEIVEASARLEAGQVPLDFEGLVDRIAKRLAAVLAPYDCLIVHNLFTKHFNLPLTAALYRLIDAGRVGRCIAWCHDFTWTSRNSRPKVRPGYPWDLLRTYRTDIAYVVVSHSRQVELAGLFGCPQEVIRVVYNGVDPQAMLGLSPEGQALAGRLGLLQADLVLLMPVRVTQAKNIEYALQVVAAIKRRGLRPILVLTGPPDPHDPGSMAYFESLRGLRGELGVEAEMRFISELAPDASELDSAGEEDPDEAYTIGSRVVGDLYRVSDVMFMPSHREGFGMPVVEAGLAGLPVVSTHVPAAVEIGGEDVTLFDPGDDPDTVAGRILLLTESSPRQRLRRRVRQGYTWQSIFHRDIEPLLAGGGRRG